MNPKPVICTYVPLHCTSVPLYTKRWCHHHQSSRGVEDEMLTRRLSFCCLGCADQQIRRKLQNSCWESLSPHSMRHIIHVSTNHVFSLSFLFFNSYRVKTKKNAVSIDAKGRGLERVWFARDGSCPEFWNKKKGCRIYRELYWLPKVTTTRKEI